MMTENKIDPELNDLFEELKNVPARDPKRAAQARARFLSQAVVIRNEAVSKSPFMRLREWLDKFNQFKEIKMTTLITIITILGLIFGGGAGTVYAAQGSLPTEFLYGVKIAAEDVALGFASDSQEEFDLLLEYAERRGDEISALLEEGIIPPDEVATRMQSEFDAAMALVSKMQEEDAADALLRVQGLLETQFSQVTGLELPADASPEVVSFLESAQAEYEGALQFTGDILAGTQSLGEGRMEGASTLPASPAPVGTEAPVEFFETAESIPTYSPDMPTIEGIPPTSVPEMPTFESVPPTSVSEMPTMPSSGMGN